MAQRTALTGTSPLCCDAAVSLKIALVMDRSACQGNCTRRTNLSAGVPAPINYITPNRQSLPDLVWSKPITSLAKKSSVTASVLVKCRRRTHTIVVFAAFLAFSERFSAVRLHLGHCPLTSAFTARKLSHLHP